MDSVKYYGQKTVNIGFPVIAIGLMATSFGLLFANSGEADPEDLNACKASLKSNNDTNFILYFLLWTSIVMVMVNWAFNIGYWRVGCAAKVVAAVTTEVAKLPENVVASGVQSGVQFGSYRW